jgi:hypothetical protein
MNMDDELEPGDAPEGDHRAPDQVDLYELPGMFVKEGTDNAPTTRPIVWAYVWKKQGAALGFIDFHPIEEMADLDQLRDAYGPGVYQIQGRGANKKDTVKQVTVTIGAGAGAQVIPYAAPQAARAELDIAKFAGIATTILTPLLTMWEGFSQRREERERARREEERAARAEEREREDARQNAFMTTMTGLMSARNQDLEALLRAQQAAPAPAAAGGARAAYSEGQADTLELIRAIKEEGLGGEDAESRIAGILEAMVVGKIKGDSDAAAAAAAPANGASS